MYIYYILRGHQNDDLIELEGDIDEETFPGVELDNGPAIINCLVQKVRTEGNTGPWEECDLTDSFFNREDTYINHHDRWIRRADAPWRKDRNN